MRLLQLGFFACAALVAAACIPNGVHAQRSQREDSVTLQLQISQPGSVVSVERARSGGAPAWVLRCQDFCSAQLPRGRYRLLLASPDREVPDTTSIRLTAPSLFISRPPQRAARNVGLLMIGAGALAAASGMVSLVYAVLSQMCDGDNCGTSPTVFWYGVAATPIGALVALGGLWMFSKARRAFDHELLSARDARLKLALTATPHGASALITGAL